jgi:hypothetical protein
MNEATKAVVKALEEVRARYKMRQKMDKSGWEIVDTGELLGDDYRVIVEADEHNEVARKWHEQCAEHIAYAANESLTGLVGELVDKLTNAEIALSQYGDSELLYDIRTILTKAKAVTNKDSV